MAMEGLLMSPIQKKTLSQPDSTRISGKGRVELVTLGGITIGRATLQPGWRWSTSVKPLTDEESCPASHLQYHVSGRLHVVLDDGSEEEFVAGDVSLIPPGHDAWVVGEEPVVLIELSGLVHYH
jgi:hypothetical protein